MRNRGEIWLADLNPPRRTEPGKTNRRLVRGPLLRLPNSSMRKVLRALAELLGAEG